VGKKHSHSSRKALSTMPRISMWESSSTGSRWLHMCIWPSHSSSEESLVSGPFHILKFGSCPFSIKCSLTVRTNNFLCPWHLEHGQCIFRRLKKVSLWTSLTHSRSSHKFCLFTSLRGNLQGIIFKTLQSLMTCQCLQQLKGYSLYRGDQSSKQHWI
jgi:hypothetical protein